MYIQDIILTLTQFWKDRGYTFISSYDLPKGAATFSREMIFRLLRKQNTKMCFLERCIRNQDAVFRPGKRLFQHHQFEVISFLSNAEKKSSLLHLYMKSLQAIGISPTMHTIEVLEDNWSQTSLSARGFGWEVRCDGVEITQITYFTNLGSIVFENDYPLEFAYGIERLACISQKKSNIFETMWSSSMSFADIFFFWEKQNCSSEMPSTICNDILILEKLLLNCEEMISARRQMLAYDLCVLASAFLNKIFSQLQHLLQRKFLAQIESLSKRVLC